METTKNLGLMKESADEFYNIETVNKNLDKIDEVFQKLTWFGVCGSPPEEAKKTVDLDGFQLYDGARVVVYFSYGNTANEMTLDINDTGAAPVHYNGKSVPAGYIHQAGAVELVYYWNYWRVVGELTQAQVEPLKTKVSSLQTENRNLKEEVSNLKNIVSFLCDEVGVSLEEKIGVDYDDGRLWEYRGHDTIAKITVSINGAKCTDVPIQGGAKYKVFTNMSSDCTNPACVMEVLKSGSEYSVSTAPLSGKEGPNTFEFTTKENSTNLLINCSGDRSEIKVYKLKY